jgi:hypothetical protein
MTEQQHKVPKTFYMGADSNSDYLRLFTKAGFVLVNSPEKADLLVFTGGWDVNPLLYGEAKRPETMFNEARDASDLKLLREGKDKLKVGICRGGQFLNVMNGGKMWQHVDNHTRDHKLIDQFTNQSVMVTSTHHQMMRPSHQAVIVALARESSYKYTDMQIWKIKPDDNQPLQNHLKKDYEVLWYPRTRSLCFQPHPEFIEAASCREYFYSVLRRVIDGTMDREVEARKQKKG